MEHFFKIGEVCRLYGITPDTLRHYEAKGLLRPWRDPKNGYRYYQETELDVIDLILAAKTLGIPLSKIGRVIESEDEACYLAEFRAQAELLHKKIAALTHRLQVTEERCAVLEALQAFKNGQDVLEKQAQTIYIIRVDKLFALETEPAQMEGLETLSSWRIFKNKEGYVEEDETWPAFSFAPARDPSPLECAFMTLAAQGVCQQQSLLADDWQGRFWGADAALCARLETFSDSTFFVRTLYSLLHRDGRHEHFVDIYAGDAQNY